MNLKIEIPNTNDSFVVEIYGSERPFGELLAIITAKLEKLCKQQLRYKFKLSLNGLTPIEVTNDDLSVASVGIVNEDVLYLLVDQQIVNIINGDNSCKKAEKKCNTNQTKNLLSRPNPEPKEIKIIAENKLCEGRTSKSYFDEVHLIREIEEDKFPKSLIEEFEKSEVSNDFQALLVVFRILMKEEGFKIQNITDPKSSSVKIDLIFKDSDVGCKFVINLIEDTIIIYGIYSKVLRFSLVQIQSFIRRKPYGDFSLLNYQQLPTLSQQFKDNVVLPLITEIKRDLGIFNHLQLDNLPVITLIKIMKLLDDKDLRTVSLTCSTLNILGNDNLLWKRLFEMKGLKDSTTSSEDGKINWKMKFRREKIAIKESENKLRKRIAEESFNRNRFCRGRPTRPRRENLVDWERFRNAPFDHSFWRV